MKTTALVSAIALAATANLAHAAYQLNLSSALSAQDPIVQAMEKASQTIAERSDDELTVRVFPNSQLRW